jgi:16S rRNA (guanine527-N7)-methyltransferase
MSDAAARMRTRAAHEGLALSDELSDRLVVYFDLLQRWNRKINLTSISDLNEAVDRLLLEPLAAAAYFPQRATLADLGSGGGSPAIPLALALGSARLLMVESRSRKAAFLREAARELELVANVETARFEAVCMEPTYASRFDIASIRAVRQDSVVLSAAAALVRPGGLVALFQSATVDALPPPMPPDLTWRATKPLLRSTGSQLTILFHVEQY